MADTSTDLLLGESIREEDILLPEEGEEEEEEEELVGENTGEVEGDEERAVKEETFWGEEEDEVEKMVTSSTPKKSVHKTKEREIEENVVTLEEAAEGYHLLCSSLTSITPSFSCATLGRSCRSEDAPIMANTENLNNNTKKRKRSNSEGEENNGPSKKKARLMMEECEEGEGGEEEAVRRGESKEQVGEGENEEFKKGGCGDENRKEKVEGCVDKTEAEGGEDDQKKREGHHGADGEGEKEVVEVGDEEEDGDVLNEEEEEEVGECGSGQEEVRFEEVVEEVSKVREGGEVEGEEEKGVCSKCGDHTSSLHRHRRLPHTLPCSWTSCRRACTSPSGLRRHERVEHPLVCPACGVEERSELELGLHLSLCTGGPREEVLDSDSDIEFLEEIVKKKNSDVEVMQEVVNKESDEEKFMDAMGAGGVVRVRGVEADELAVRCLAMLTPSGAPTLYCLQSAVAVDMMARRVAFQVCSEVGLVVGKVTPLVEMRGPDSRLVVTNMLTLQKEVEEDPTLARYGMVVLDEVGNTSEGDLDTVLKLRLKEAVRVRGELVVVLGAGEGEGEARLDRRIFTQLREVRLAGNSPSP